MRLNPAFHSLFFLSCLAPHFAEAMTVCEYNLTVPRDDLVIRIMIPFDLETPTINSYVESTGAHPPRLVRIGRLNGEDYEIRLPREAVLRDGAQSEDPFFYAVYQTELTSDPRVINNRSLELFPLNRDTEAYRILDQERMQLAQTYLDDDVLNPTEWEEFLKTDRAVELGRLVHVSLSSRSTGERLAYLRLIDGTSFPGLSLGLHSEISSSPLRHNPKVRLESRYSSANLRKISEDIYELSFYFIKKGLTWDPRPYILHAISPYFYRKYGRLGAAPIQQLERAIVVQEAPGSRRRLYTKDVRNGGYGFHEVPHPSGEAGKGVLYMSLPDFMILPLRLIEAIPSRK